MFPMNKHAIHLQGLRSNDITTCLNVTTFYNIAMEPYSFKILHSFYTYNNKCLA